MSAVSAMFVMSLWSLAENVVILQGSFIELAILFAILAIVAAALGAGGVAGISMNIAKWFIIAFVLLAIITALL
ncbi:DUF1328 family protein [Natronorarus salvus]|uniref:DUF1328 family protein n=1 Tax=Natronorarus salvus TaxID=3117733 RepID=UPI002F268792